MGGSGRRCEAARVTTSSRTEAAAPAAARASGMAGGAVAASAAVPGRFAVAMGRAGAVAGGEGPVGEGRGATRGRDSATGVGAAGAEGGDVNEAPVEVAVGTAPVVAEVAAGAAAIVGKADEVACREAPTVLEEAEGTAVVWDGMGEDGSLDAAAAGGAASAEGPPLPVAGSTCGDLARGEGAEAAAGWRGSSAGATEAGAEVADAVGEAGEARDTAVDVEGEEVVGIGGAVTPVAAACRGGPGGVGRGS